MVFNHVRRHFIEETKFFLFLFTAPQAVVFFILRYFMRAVLPVDFVLRNVG